MSREFLRESRRVFQISDFRMQIEKRDCFAALAMTGGEEDVDALRLLRASRVSVTEKDFRLQIEKRDLIADFHTGSLLVEVCGNIVSQPALAEALVNEAESVLAGPFVFG